MVSGLNKPLYYDKIWEIVTFIYKERDIQFIFVVLKAAPRAAHTYLQLYMPFQR